MNGFDIFRINCWLEDIEENNYEESIRIIIYEYLLSKENEEQTRSEIFNFIRKTLGIRINYEKFLKIIDVENGNDLVISPIEDDLLVKLSKNALQSYREKTDKYSIYVDIEEYVKYKELPQEYSVSIKNILFKSLYININSFIKSDLKSILSESVKKDFSKDEVEEFNSFLDWDNTKKNKAIYSLFSKTIEFAILTSGRGVSSISNEVFTNKVYYLDANVVLRALGIDGNQRKDSIVSILESCQSDGIKFKISKVTYDEIYKNLNKRVTDINNKLKSIPTIEEKILPILDDLPLKSSFEVDYLRKRKEKKVSSPNRYRLYLETEYQKFSEKFSIKVDAIKGIKQSELEKLKNTLYKKKKSYGMWSYTKGAAFVDAKNILYVAMVREYNNYNYKDIKSFYLTTDTTLNEILSEESEDKIVETILPSQLFVIHNSFNKKSTKDDYNDFVKYIKVRRTDFKLPGKEIFNYVEQIAEVTTNPNDISSILVAYANYRFQNKNDYVGESSLQTVTLKEFAERELEKELGNTREEVLQLITARKEAINRLPKKYKIAEILSYFSEIIIISLASFIYYLVTKNTNSTVFVFFGIVLFRILLLLFKDKIGLNRFFRLWFYDKLVKRDNFFKLYKNDIKYISEIKKYK